MEKETELQKANGTSPWELAKEQGAEMGDVRSHPLNLYSFFFSERKSRNRILFVAT